MTRATITRAIDVRDPAAYPSWRLGMAVNEWKHITGTAIPARPINYSGDGGDLIDAYNGLAVDQVGSRLFLAGAGGHNDYFGNEGYVIDLGLDSPSWSMLGTPTPEIQLNLNSSYNADGKPASSHTYYSQQYVGGAVDRIMRFAAGALAGGSANADYEVVGMSATTGVWSANGDFDDVYPVVHGGSAVICCQNPSNDDVYVMTRSGGYWIRYRVSGSSLIRTELTPMTSAGAMSGAASAVDTLRGKVLCVRDATTARVYDIAGDSWSLVTITGYPGAAGSGQALEYDAQNDRYVVLPGYTFRGRVWSINAANIAAGASEVTTSGVTVPVGGYAGQGVYNRFRYMPNLGGFAYYPTELGGTGIYFLATE